MAKQKKVASKTASSGSSRAKSVVKKAVVKPVKAAKKKVAKVAKVAKSATSKATPKKVAEAIKPVKKVVEKVAPKAAKKAVKSVERAVDKAVDQVAAIAANPKGAVKAAVKTAVATVGKQVAPKSVVKAAAKVSAAMKPADLPHVSLPAPSSKLVFMKLGHRKGESTAVVAAPRGFKLPQGVEEVATLRGPYEFILLFVESEEEAQACAADLKQSLVPAGKVWITWPKGGASQLDKDILTRVIEQHGLVSVTNLTLDERWTALKFMYPKEERGQA